MNLGRTPLILDHLRQSDDANAVLGLALLQMEPSEAKRVEDEQGKKCPILQDHHGVVQVSAGTGHLHHAEDKDGH